jgi:hypothetical protein
LLNKPIFSIAKVKADWKNGPNRRIRPNSRNRPTEMHFSCCSHQGTI